ncbi:IS3 family transposase [Anaerococcus octavius]|uniref:IS3 family transposase n=1 Tax=Anaerococcus octavius TaxID=54007 RepID=UPI00352A6367
MVKTTKGRYGYRRVNTILRNKGLMVNHKRVLRIMKQEGYSVLNLELGLENTHHTRDKWVKLLLT